MINTQLEELIKTAVKSRDELGVQVLRLIKAEFLNAEKSAGFSGWSDNAELKILMKMAAQRKDSIEQYTNGGRADLVEAEQKELSYIEKFIPKQPTEEEVASYTQEVIDEMKEAGEEVSMKSMKGVLAKVQEKYSMANGKVVSQIVRNNI